MMLTRGLHLFCIKMIEKHVYSSFFHTVHSAQRKAAPAICVALTIYRKSSEQTAEIPGQIA